MDKIREENDKRELLMEVLNVQELILHRVEQLEDTLARLNTK